MKSAILKLVEAKHKSSGGSCGVYLKDIASELDISLSEMEELAVEMYNNEEIDVRPGIHGFMLMIFAKTKTDDQRNRKRN